MKKDDPNVEAIRCLRGSSFLESGLSREEVKTTNDEGLLYREVVNDLRVRVSSDWESEERIVLRT